MKKEIHQFLLLFYFIFVFLLFLNYQSQHFQFNSNQIKQTMVFIKCHGVFLYMEYTFFLFLFLFKKRNIHSSIINIEQNLDSIKIYIVEYYKLMCHNITRSIKKKNSIIYIDYGLWIIILCIYIILTVTLIIVGFSLTLLTSS